MLLLITRYTDLDERKLMDIYAEGNRENAEDLYAGMPNRAEALKRAEEDFLTFLRDTFFKTDESTYWVYTENGTWLSALRTCRIRDRFYYLEALETRPNERQKGYAARLIEAVLNELQKDGAFTVCDCVGKQNLASLRTHERCGFRIVSDAGFNYLYGETNEYTFGLAYRYDGSKQQ